MAEAGRERDHKTHMGGRQAVQRGLVPLLFPANGKEALLLALEEGSVHGGTNEAATNP
jgi:hypothetical protein